MTREEREQALEWFKNRPITMSGAKRMYDLAIAALEQLEPCEDAVSRKAVLDINTQYHGQMPNELNHQIWKDIKALPSAQPEKVKCKKCRYVYYDKEFGNYWCNRMYDSFMVEEDGYCKWGK